MTRHPVERRREPRDEEEAASFKGLGQAIIVIRERRGMDRVTLAGAAGMATAELEKIERGEFDEWWGGLRMIAKALGMTLPGLMLEAEELAPGPGGESWRQRAGEPKVIAMPRARGDAAEARARSGPDARK